MYTKTASSVGSLHTGRKCVLIGLKIGLDCSIASGGELLFSPRLMLLAIDRFDIDPFSLELSDNELLTDSLSSIGISNFGIFTSEMHSLKC